MSELQDINTPAQVVEYFGKAVSERFIKNLARDKKIGSIKMGQQVLIPRAAVEQYVADHMTPAESQPWGLTDAATRSIRDARSNRAAS